jgi:DNA replication protein DnaC
LRLSAVADLYSAVAQDVAAKEASFADFLEAILRAERDARRVRAREMFARVAGFPAVKTLDGFDFGFATGAPRQQIHELAGLAFIERAENVVFLGPSGVGKTHLAIALGAASPHQATAAVVAVEQQGRNKVPQGLFARER